MTSFDEIKFINQHYIYVESKLASNKQLEDCLTSCFEKNKHLLKNINLNHQINIITKQDGTTFGYGYIWVQDKKLYHLLLGKNEDGSERIIEEDDENWSPDSSVQEQYKNWITKGIPQGMSWFDCTEIEDDFLRKLTPPKTKKFLPPLIIVPPFNYDDQQKLNDQTKKSDSFIFKPASISSKDTSVITHKLFCPSLPSDVSESILKNIFDKFSTSTTKVSINDNGKKINDLSYPIITIEKKKNTIAIISFDPNTNDGLFALLMTRKVYIPNIGFVYFDYYRDKSIRY
jgi:hypothetical protein